MKAIHCTIIKRSKWLNAPNSRFLHLKSGVCKEPGGAGTIQRAVPKKVISNQCLLEPAQDDRSASLISDSLITF